MGKTSMNRAEISQLIQEKIEQVDEELGQNDDSTASGREIENYLIGYREGLDYVWDMLNRWV